MAEVGDAIGKKTQADRDVYKTPDGKNVSELSATFKYKGKWINIPSIHNGYQYDEDILRMMLDAEVITPTSTHKSKPDALEAARERSESLEFNEGGMADYRKRLVDMTEEERAEVAPSAPQFSDDYENVDDPLSVQMMEAGLDFTPLGTVKGVSDIKDELSKDDPNYLKALGMSAVEAAGIIPGAAPVLKGMVKGSFKTSKGTNKQVSNTEYDARMAQLDEAPDADTWQTGAKDLIKEGRVSDPSVKTPELEESTRMLLENKITREEHLSNVDKYKSVDAWDAFTS